MLVLGEGALKAEIRALLHTIGFTPVNSPNTPKTARIEAIGAKLYTFLKKASTKNEKVL